LEPGTKAWNRAINFKRYTKYPKRRSICPISSKKKKFPSEKTHLLLP